MSTCTDRECGILLHAYELDLLPDEDEERFELHLMTCEHCLGQVREFRAEHLLLTRDRRIRERVGALAGGPDPRPAGSAWSRLWRHLWPEGPLVFRPALLYIVVLALLIPAIRGLQPDGRRGPEGVRAVNEIGLFPLRGGEEPVLESGGAGEAVITVLFPGALAGESYRLVIESEGGMTVYSDDAFTGFDEESAARLILPLAGLEPGRYRLSVTDPRRDPPADTEEYFFRLRALSPPAE